jgi:hypothetical protein
LTFHRDRFDEFDEFATGRLGLQQELLRRTLGELDRARRWMLQKCPALLYTPTSRPAVRKIRNCSNGSDG